MEGRHRIRLPHLDAPSEQAGERLRLVLVYPSNTAQNGIVCALAPKAGMDGDGRKNLESGWAVDGGRSVTPQATIGCDFLGWMGRRRGRAGRVRNERRNVFLALCLPQT